MNIVNIISLFDFKLGEFKSQLKVKRMIYLHRLIKILQVLRIQI